MNGRATARVPNFFIIGAPKCGTSSLAAYLAEHPRVFVSIPKEPFYWSADYPGLRRTTRLETLDDYLALFRGATADHVAIGEGSTSYLSSEVAVRDILAFNPEARFIVMLRDPVETCYAHHQQHLFMLYEDVEDFEEAWRLQEARRAGRSIPATCVVPEFLQYGAIGRYGRQVERLLSTAPAGRVKVIIFDDFARDPRRSYVEALEFLGLPDDGRREFPRVNEAKVNRSRWLARALRSGPMTPLLIRLKAHADRNPGGLAAKARRALKVSRPRPALRPEFVRELGDYFAPDVARLSDLLGRDLSHWAGGAARARAGAGAVAAGRPRA